MTFMQSLAGKAILTIFLTTFSGMAFSNVSPWNSVNISKIKSDQPKYIIAKSAQYYHLNLEVLKGEFAQCPQEKNGKKVEQYGKEISIPMSDGSAQRFAFAKYDLMEDGLKKNWDFIQTYLGVGLDDPMATCKLDFTLLGFHSQILSPKGNTYIDPVFHGNVEYYQVYEKADLDFLKMNKQFVCGLKSGNEPKISSNSPSTNPSTASIDGIRRVYRIAIGATAEYTAFQGGLSKAASAIATTLNRVNGIYENELSIRLILISSNNSLIFDNASSDPYTNDNQGAMLDQNQAYMNTNVGPANYDIGHVFSTSFGGVAGAGVVCISDQKARGVTGSDAPVGDPYDIDFVAHEIGHQFGASHTFNSVSGNCGADNREPTTAFEPGSGSTIMGYAGICSPQNIQNQSDGYFHFISLEEINLYHTQQEGSTCPFKQFTGNTPPSIPALPSGYTIPINTPFKLVSPLASDLEGDKPTYCWEENDLGPPGISATATLTAPIFRSFFPTSSRERVFPTTLDLLRNTLSRAERLPSYSRALNFKLTVRDNRGAAVSTRLNLTANVSGGAFSVTSPNLQNLSFVGGSNLNVTWNAGNTAIAPFNVPKVKINLSIDGGVSFNISLLDSTENDGSATVLLPGLAAANCRIMVESIGNVFFDISNFNFKMTAPPTEELPFVVSDTALCAGSSFDVLVNPGVQFNSGNTFSVQLSNSNGLFTAPTIIGSKQAQGSTTIACTLPLNLISGTGYKLQILSSNPLRTSAILVAAPKIKGLPNALSLIYGLAEFCTGDSSKTYQIEAVSGINAFKWQLPSGSTFKGDSLGNVISVNFGNQDGIISASGVNSCGIGPQSSLSVSKIVPLASQVSATVSAFSVCSGSTVSFNAKPVNGGKNPTYQWLLNGSPIAGALEMDYNTSTYVNGDRFTVRLFSSLSCGVANTSTSNQIVLAIRQRRSASTSIESNAFLDTSCVGDPITFSATVNSGGGTNPRYAWFLNSNPIQGQFSNSALLNNLVSTDTVRLRVTISGTCLTNNVIFSNKIRTYIVKANAGLDTILCANTQVQLRGVPLGGTWTGNGVNSNGLFAGIASGTAILTYNISQNGCVSSDAKQINIGVPNVTYSVKGDTLRTARNKAIGFVWYLNGAPITGATDSIYIMQESGEYCVEVTFTGGCKSKSICQQQIITDQKEFWTSDNKGLILFPNPVHNELMINWQDENVLEKIEINNLIGQKIMILSIPSNTAKHNLVLGQLSKGVYLLIGTTRNGRQIQRTLIKD